MFLQDFVEQALKAAGCMLRFDVLMFFSVPVLIMLHQLQGVFMYLLFRSQYFSEASGEGWVGQNYACVK